MTAIYMNPDAAVAVAERMADVAAELEERAAVIDRLLDEVGRSSAAPARCVPALSWSLRSAARSRCGQR